MGVAAARRFRSDAGAPTEGGGGTGDAEERRLVRWEAREAEDAGAAAALLGAGERTGASDAAAAVFAATFLDPGERLEIKRETAGNMTTTAPFCLWVRVGGGWGWFWMGLWCWVDVIDAARRRLFVGERAGPRLFGHCFGTPGASFCATFSHFHVSNGSTTVPMHSWVGFAVVAPRKSGARNGRRTRSGSPSPTFARLFPPTTTRAKNTEKAARPSRVQAGGQFHFLSILCLTAMRCGGRYHLDHLVCLLVVGSSLASVLCRDAT